MNTCAQPGTPPAAWQGPNEDTLQPKPVHLSQAKRCSDKRGHLCLACWTACAQWAAGPALDGRRATLLGLGLNEGLGLISAKGRQPRLYLHASYLLPAERHSESSRGTPRLRWAPQVWVCFPCSPALAGKSLLAAKFSLGGLFKRAGGTVPETWPRINSIF